ncbi:hypothetical protein TPA0598_08_04810 [Streptomyces lydicamycinicus]|uniref:Uncharacterized protein n=1 Tax=Streptomyces lydicamycinicus TaxID=1546107 RepID=A0A0P4REF5_9ACTN|nr:hypothetical protein TPA0598_08_04810 [Streptomyces lydicamycinicus]
MGIVDGGESEDESGPGRGEGECEGGPGRGEAAVQHCSVRAREAGADRALELAQAIEGLSPGSCRRGGPGPACCGPHQQRAAAVRARQEAKSPLGGYPYRAWAAAWTVFGPAARMVRWILDTQTEHIRFSNRRNSPCPV